MLGGAEGAVGGPAGAVKGPGGAGGTAGTVEGPGGAGGTVGSPAGCVVPGGRGGTAGGMGGGGFGPLKREEARVLALPDMAKSRRFATHYVGKVGSVEPLDEHEVVVPRTKGDDDTDA